MMFLLFFVTGDIWSVVFIIAILNAVMHNAKKIGTATSNSKTLQPVRPSYAGGSPGCLLSLQNSSFRLEGANDLK